MPSSGMAFPVYGSCGKIEAPKAAAIDFGIWIKPFLIICNSAKRNMGSRIAHVGSADPLLTQVRDHLSLKRMNGEVEA